MKKKGKLRQLGCGHYVFATKKQLINGKKWCNVCPDLNHMEDINKAIKLKINPRGIGKPEGKVNKKLLKERREQLRSRERWL